MSDLSVRRLESAGDSTAWVPEHPQPTHRQGSLLRLGAILVGVLLLHAAVFALLVQQTYRAPIILANTEPPASVRVTIRQAAPPPPPVVETPPSPAPQILTSERAKRSVAIPPVPSPPPPQPLPAKPAPAAPKPKPIPRPKPAPPRPAPAPPAPAPVEQPRPAIAAPSAPVASDSSGERYMELPTSGPKDVQTVGCRIPQPSYPRSALRQRAEGTVLVQLVINPQGRVDRPVVLRSSGHPALDQAAVEAVMKASCNPYIENGRAIAVRAAQSISFDLKR